ncbi:MAG: hypothetical protein EOO51_00880 [Flavobacterium sp.]|nr:MAG: hypothetical protein EOO51_00880 [Flavobacterium sp.]
MKKLTTILIACFFLFACAPEDNRSITFLDARVNDTIHLFNTFHVDSHDFTTPDYAYTEITVTASIERSPERVIGFTVEQYLLGTEACYYFVYIDDGISYEKFDDSFVFTVVENSATRLRGIFSGKLKSPQTGEIINVTGGTFDVFHY